MNKDFTSDGIPTDEWKLVEELADKVLDANLSDDSVMESKYKAEMVDLLDSLQRKYGDCPSIFATKADYIDSTEREIILLKKAFELSKSNGDKKNNTLISGSLAQRYIEELRDRINGDTWIKEFECCLKDYNDEQAEDELVELRNILSMLSDESV